MPTRDSRSSSPTDTLRRWFTRPVVAALVLLAVYAALSVALNDPRGTLGTDTGGKLATLRVMEAHGTLVPDVGYWASRWDPRGVLHPLYYTRLVGGRWVNVTTLPMLLAATPLYRLGGDRLVLLLPMLGALLTAFGARALSVRLSRGTGWPAFWLVGLASPVAIYALDFWEHSVGLGLMLWGVVFVCDLVTSGEPQSGHGVGGGAWRQALLAGMLFGLAATMRTEALVYLVVAGVIGCAVLAWRRRTLIPALGSGVVMIAGAAVVMVANDLLERALLGTTLRSSRAAGTAEGVGSSLATRLDEAWRTTLGLNAAVLRMDVLLGAAVVVLLGLGVSRLRRPGSGLVGTVVITAAALVYLARFRLGLGFVPGVLTACPFAAVGLLAGWRRGLRLPTAIAVGALPLVWAFQYSGGAGPQWGGRYELLTGVLLAVVGITVVQSSRRALAAVALVSVLVTGFGVAWLSARSHGVVHATEAVLDRDDQMVISRDAHFFREAGAFYDPSRHWLTATTPAQLRAAVQIASASGATEFALIDDVPAVAPPKLGGYTRTGSDVITYTRDDVRLRATTYELR
jgi:hypothetical protein